MIQRLLLNEICKDIHLLASCGWDGSRMFCWKLDGKKYWIWECLFAHRKQGLFLPENVDEIKEVGRKRNMAQTWKKLMKNVDLDEPTSFLDDVYRGCTQRECKPNEITSDEYRKMFGSRISAGATEKLPEWEKLHAKTMAWSYDIEGHAKKCEEILRIGKHKDRAVIQSLNPMLGRPSVQERRRNWNRLENRQKYAHRSSGNACIWHVLVDQTFFGLSTNLLQQSPNGQEPVQDA